MGPPRTRGSGLRRGRWWNAAPPLEPGDRSMRKGMPRGRKEAASRCRRSCGVSRWGKRQRQRKVRPSALGSCGHPYRGSHRTMRHCGSVRACRCRSGDRRSRDPLRWPSPQEERHWGRGTVCRGGGGGRGGDTQGSGHRIRFQRSWWDRHDRDEITLCRACVGSNAGRAHEAAGQTPARRWEDSVPPPALTRVVFTQEVVASEQALRPAAHERADSQQVKPADTGGKGSGRGVVLSCLRGLRSAVATAVRSGGGIPY